MRYQPRGGGWPTSIGDFISRAKTKGTIGGCNLTAQAGSASQFTAPGPGIMVCTGGTWTWYIRINGTVVSEFRDWAWYSHPVWITFSKWDIIHLQAQNYSVSLYSTFRC